MSVKSISEHFSFSLHSVLRPRQHKIRLNTITDRIEFLLLRYQFLNLKCSLHLRNKMRQTKFTEICIGVLHALEDCFFSRPIQQQPPSQIFLIRFYLFIRAYITVGYPMNPLPVLFNINANRIQRTKCYRHISFRMRNTDIKGMIGKKRFSFGRVNNLFVFL